MFYIGIAVSKKSCCYFILNQGGQKVKSFSLDNTQEAFQNLPERLKSLSIPNPMRDRSPMIDRPFRKVFTSPQGEGFSPSPKEALKMYK